MRWKQLSVAVLLAVTSPNDAVEFECCRECCEDARNRDKVIALNLGACRDGCYAAKQGLISGLDASDKVGHDYYKNTFSIYALSANYCFNLTCSRPDGWNSTNDLKCETNHVCEVCPEQ